MKIQIDTKDIDLKKVFEHCLLVSIALIMVISIFYPIVALLDSRSDTRNCYIGMSSQNVEINSCFANDDMWTINFGHNISCTCYPKDMSTKYDFVVK